MVIFTSLVIVWQFPEIIVICDVIPGKQATACFVYIEIRYNLLRKFTCLIFHNPFLHLCPCVCKNEKFSDTKWQSVQESR